MFRRTGDRDERWPAGSGPSHYEGVRFEGLNGRLDLHDVRCDRCIFDNCSGRGGVGRRLEAIGCAVWSCRLFDVVLEDCLLENLKTSSAGGGRTMPFFLQGVMVRRVSIRGTIGGFIWTPPDSRTAWASPAAVRAARRFYGAVGDWALDVSAARFRSVPSFRFGPPGALVRRDPETQPLISRSGAEAALREPTVDFGIWKVVLEDFVGSPWPDEIVLIPGLGAPRRAYEADLAALDRLRGTGAFER